ncbi:MAG: hypothetical protein WCK76_04465 [Elusimicrobiota bacterium]
MKKKKCYLYNFPSLAGEPRVKEPSVLYSVPDKRHWVSEFVFNNEVKPDGDLYLCSVFTCGLPDFAGFAKQVGKEKIIAGGYHASLCPDDLTGLAAKVIVGYGNNIDEIIKSPAKGIVRGKFRYNHMDRSVFPLEELKEAWYADIFPGRRSLSISTFMGCPFPCDFSDNCYIFATFRNKKVFYPASYIKEELKLLRKYGYEYLFIRDEGFFLHPEFDKIVELLAAEGRKIYSFLGPLDGFDERRMKMLKAAGWFCLTFGFNVQQDHQDDPELLRVAALAHKYGINIHMNAIIKGGTDKTSGYYMNTVGNMLLQYMPASMELYFWTPYPGTRSFEEYRGKYPEESYRLLSDLHFKSNDQPLRELHRKRLLALQVMYYRSREYAKLRKFNCGDELSLRVNRLLRRGGKGAA